MWKQLFNASSGYRWCRKTNHTSSINKTLDAGAQCESISLVYDNMPQNSQLIVSWVRSPNFLIQTYDMNLFVFDGAFIIQSLKALV